MILIGQYDSPFVRRVAIALRLYQLDYEHRPWSVWRDSEKLAGYNPLMRVPVLLLESGEALIDSAAILDTLDERAGGRHRLLASSGPLRRAGLQVIALATGIADKAVSLVYEQALRPTDARSQVWTMRCHAQIRQSLDTLELGRRASGHTWWLDEHLGHADIAVGCMLQFLRDAHPSLFPATGTKLAAHAEACEALLVFQGVFQRLTITLDASAPTIAPL